MKASFKPYFLSFKNPVKTSRGEMWKKKTYILEVEDQGKIGVGECALFENLSADNVEEYEIKLHWLCENIDLDEAVLYEELRDFPSIQIGLEQALLNLYNEKEVYFKTQFTQGKEGIGINGLVWMGSIQEMRSRFQEKVKEGYRVVKLKIGVDWLKEKELLAEVRTQYSAKELEVRVDANGAFSAHEVFAILEELKQLEIHSIEQPIAKGQHSEMQQLCAATPVPIALDEELIGAFYPEQKKELLDTIQPQYIILKPSLVGGFRGCDEWISYAEERNIGWWITSALESNIGLNAIAQYTSSLNTNRVQGLGTGGLYTNNFPSLLSIENCKLWHHLEL